MPSIILEAFLQPFHDEGEKDDLRQRLKHANALYRADTLLQGLTPQKRFDAGQDAQHRLRSIAFRKRRASLLRDKYMEQLPSVERDIDDLGESGPLFLQALTNQLKVSNSTLNLSMCDGDELLYYAIVPSVDRELKKLKARSEMSVSFGGQTDTTIFEVDSPPVATTSVPPHSQPVKTFDGKGSTIVSSPQVASPSFVPRQMALSSASRPKFGTTSRPNRPVQPSKCQEVPSGRMFTGPQSPSTSKAGYFGSFSSTGQPFHRPLSGRRVPPIHKAIREVESFEAWAKLQSIMDGCRNTVPAFDEHIRGARRELEGFTERRRVTDETSFLTRFHRQGDVLLNRISDRALRSFIEEQLLGPATDTIRRLALERKIAKAAGTLEGLELGEDLFLGALQVKSHPLVDRNDDCCKSVSY